MLFLAYTPEVILKGRKQKKGKQSSTVPSNDKRKPPGEKEKRLLPLDYCHALFVKKKSAKINRTSGGCVTAPDLGDSLWQGNKYPQFLKIDKLVYSHAVNCLIVKPTNHKLKVTVLPGNKLLRSSTYEVGPERPPPSLMGNRQKKKIQSDCSVNDEWWFAGPSNLHLRLVKVPEIIARK